MTLDDIIAIVQQDFEGVNQLIRNQLHSTVPFISSVGDYITNSGGKRIRPLICLLTAKACAYHSGDDHIKLASVIELLHTATLLHDDVVDDSHLRRGKATVNAIWGNSPSILVGDFLISRAFQMIVSLGNMRTLEVISNTTNQIAEGEVLQLLNCHNPDTTEQDYYQVIRLKTAKMFEAAAECGAIISGSGTPHEKALASYALHLGNAFQLVDDILDYTGDPNETGKNVGDDLNEGKPTLPLIYALQNCSTEDATLIKEALSRKTSPAHITKETTLRIIDIIHSCGAIEFSTEKARDEANKAIDYLSILNDTPYKEALEYLAKLSVNRTG